MKKFLKMLASLGVLAAIGGAIYYVYKTYLQDREFDDLDDEDWDDEDYDDLDEEDCDSRSYVTLNLEPEAPAEGTPVEEAPAPEETPAE